MPKFYGKLPPREDARRLRFATLLAPQLGPAPSAVDLTCGITE